MRKFSSNILMAFALCMPGGAWADDVIYAVPAGWRLQNYVGGHLAAYYAGTPCYAGQVLMPSAATAEERDRFIAMVTTAKVAGRHMGVYYETTSGNCLISSFFLQD